MKVKIIGEKGNCESIAWYFGRVGEEFSVVGAGDSYEFDYFIDEGPLQGGGLYKRDCQLISWGIDDAYDQPTNVPWVEAATYHKGEKITYKYPETKPVVAKKSVEQLAIDVLLNTTGKLYTEREIMAIVSIVNSVKSLEDV